MDRGLVKGRSSCDFATIGGPLDFPSVNGMLPRRGSTMTYDPTASDYYRPDALEPEILRIFGICNACRLCLDLCPAFPALFEAMDRHADLGEGETDALGEEEIGRVGELCYDCRRCLPKCPYAPPHELDVDFPRLMLRAKAVDVRQKGIALKDRILGRPDLVGRLGTLAPAIANGLNALGVSRWLVEKSVGLHRRADLPRFAAQPFARWFKRESGRRPAPTPSARPTARVALFATCTVNYYDVAVGQALSQVLWHNQVEVVLPKQRCCGMPHLESGDVDGAIVAARANVALLLPWVDQGYDVVSPGPSCSLMMRDDYPRLLGTVEARRVAEHTFDACEYLMQLNALGKLDRQFKAGSGRVGYHAACHLKAQNIGLKSRDLLRLLPDTSVEPVDTCSMAEGGWGVTAAHFDLAHAGARKLYDGLEASGAERFVSDCPRSRRQIAHATGKSTRHPAELLRDAYGLPRPAA
jgi:glycerol-3-phosphate dehydrogenase subunit C